MAGLELRGTTKSHHATVFTWEVDWTVGVGGRQKSIKLKISPEEPNSIRGWSTLKHLVGHLAHDECSGTMLRA